MQPPKTYRHKPTGKHAAGNRVRKVIVKGNITENRYYVGDYEIFTKTNNGTVETEQETLHINDSLSRTGFGNKQKVALIDYDTQNQSTTIRYQLTNHLDSASIELDENADIISYEEYQPFGTTSYRSGRSETEVSLKRYKFQMKEKDNETGLHYHGARYYAPWIGRWTSTDPKQHEFPYQNPYTGFDNKPIILVDPDGKGARITYWVDENGVTHAVVTANIYVYTDENSDIDIENFAKFYEDSLNTIFNSSNDGNPYFYVYKPRKNVKGEYTQRAGTREKAKVTYKFNVEPITQKEAIKMADKNNRNKENNYFYVNTGRYNLSNGGNSGALGLNYHRTRHVHEFIHMLGWSKFSFGINGHYGGDHADYDTEKHSIMWFGQRSDEFFTKFLIKGLPDLDFRRLNYNQPIGSSKSDALSEEDYVKYGLSDYVEYSEEIRSVTFGAEALDHIYTTNPDSDSVYPLIINTNGSLLRDTFDRQ